MHNQCRNDPSLNSTSSAVLQKSVHAKLGFDPCELFFGETGLTSLSPTKVSGSHGRVDKEAFGFYGLDGPATPDLALDGPADLRTVTSTVADLLDVTDDVSLDLERPSVLE